MFKTKAVLISCLLLLLAVGVFAQTPTYQPIPSTVLASGIADTKGTGGTANVEYWVWDGGNGYYYYTYRVYNTAFLPYIKHLIIGNPTGEPYYITGSSGGGPEGGVAWSYATHASLPTVIDWVCNDPSAVIYPGGCSWGNQLFQFASKLSPSSAALTVRQGDLATYAKGLIPAPGGGLPGPRSTGYWKTQYTGKGKLKEAASLPGYMDQIAAYSPVFATDLAGTMGSDLLFGAQALEVADNSDMLLKAKKELFGLWLNIVSQKLDFYGAFTFDPEAVTTTAKTVGEAVRQIEATIQNPNATAADLENAKDMAECLNVQ
jgi:hypothetical protein